ncbi:hypothetical protein T4E_8980 [Trichinella pseudospiralis]|uniref:Uncharacterized protein n=1 Tax=Trichinella pseudospiralis TaxID=6337 RepID=A0A0V0XPY9_TRIPS|nr:hypothetical protein T4E_8980 [Trichinella pseudospiralis]
MKTATHLIADGESGKVQNDRRSVEICPVIEVLDRAQKGVVLFFADKEFSKNAFCNICTAIKASKRAQKRFGLGLLCPTATGSCQMEADQEAMYNGHLFVVQTNNARCS